MADDDIDDPVKGIAFCNLHIRKLEMMIQEARQAENLTDAMRGEGHLVKWTELLENFIHQAFQQGKTTEDASKLLSNRDKRGRVNA